MLQKPLALGVSGIIAEGLKKAEIQLGYNTGFSIVGQRLVSSDVTFKNYMWQQ